MSNQPSSLTKHLRSTTRLGNWDQVALKQSMFK